jgi:hypothetical protein
MGLKKVVYVRTFSSQNYRDVTKVDEEKFTDPKRVEFLFSKETEILPDHEI